MIKQKSIQFLFFLVVPFFLFSQRGINEELARYEWATTDEKIELLYGFFPTLEDYEKDSILYYIADLQEEGIRNGRFDAIAMSNFALGSYLQGKSLFDEALIKLNKALDYYLSVENDSILVEVYNSIGNNFYLKGDYKSAKGSYLQSLNQAEKINDEKYVMLPTLNLAWVDMQNHDYENAREKINKCISFYESQEGPSFVRKLASAYGLLGQSHLNQKEYDKAIEAFTKSMEYGLSVELLQTIGQAYTNMAITSFLVEDYEKAELFFRFALGYRIRDGKSYYVSESYYNLGDFYFERNMMDSAIVNYQKSIDVAIKDNFLQSQKDGWIQLSEIYDTLNLKDEQIRALKEIIELQEAINKQNLNSETVALNISHQEDINELLSLNTRREASLEGIIDSFQSVFNRLIIVVLLAFVIVLVVLAYMRKRNQKIRD